MSHRWLLMLYPRRWRERYGDECLLMLEAQGMSIAVFLDVLAWGIQRLRLHSHQAKAAVTVLALAAFYGISFVATWMAFQT
ncbi:MAG TPA: hypothetical protein VG845_00485 [Dehalococcoidia bacterium]|jgi:hypothetical protein|nr:hypothetical protein [Dehalococcoidia bacterium]